jgi:hypothetical protein
MNASGMGLQPRGCTIGNAMLVRLGCVGILLALANVAHAAALRASAEPPLSGERLGDALRSYLDGREVTVEPAPSAALDGNLPPDQSGSVNITLRRSRGLGEDAEVVLVDGEETIVARLPGALRTEDLYRAAALKVQALLQRRTSVAMPPPAVGVVSEWPPPPVPVPRDRFVLDAGLAWMQPSDGLAREALRLGAGLRLGNRWRLGLGTYLEPPQSTTSQGIDVSSWEIPLWLSLGWAWHKGLWESWLDAVAHAAIRRITAKATGIVSTSDTTLSPRAGGTLGFAIGVAPGLRAEAGVSLLAVLADTRYRVDGQVVWPAARALVMVELGLAYGVR